MYKSSSTKIALTVLALSWLIIGPCRGAEFTADMVSRIAIPATKSKSAVDHVEYRDKLYVRGNIERREGHTVIYWNGGDTNYRPPSIIEINMPEKGLKWIIYPNSKSYRERRFQPAKNYNPVRGLKYIGDEVVNGYACEKYTTQVELPDGKVTSTVWYSIKLKYIIKYGSTNTDGSSDIHELENITIKRLPDNLFQPPDGYKKIPDKKIKKTKG